MLPGHVNLVRLIKITVQRLKVCWLSRCRRSPVSSLVFPSNSNTVSVYKKVFTLLRKKISVVYVPPMSNVINIRWRHVLYLRLLMKLDALQRRSGTSAQNRCQINMIWWYSLTVYVHCWCRVMRCVVWISLLLPALMFGVLLWRYRALSIVPSIIPSLSHNVLGMIWTLVWNESWWWFVKFGVIKKSKLLYTEVGHACCFSY